MHQTRLAACLLAGVAVPGSYASPVAQSKPFQTAAIASLCKHEAEGSHFYGGDNPSDDPLQAPIYVNGVAIRTGCHIYIARYAPPYDHLPGASVPVRVGKHDTAFHLEDRQMQLPIARGQKDGTANCQ